MVVVAGGDVVVEGGAVAGGTILVGAGGTVVVGAGVVGGIRTADAGVDFLGLEFKA